MSEKLEKMHAEFLASTIEQTAAKLRALADKVEAEAASVRATSGTTYAANAATVIHEIMWGVANLNLDRLPRESSEADTARATGA
jgi:hypothetical protein